MSDRPPSGIVCRKDVPDGKNFRASGMQAAPACAPGHKTAEGQQGRTDPEEARRKKLEKQERKRVQAEREEANRRKRAREQGIVLPAQPSITPGPGCAVQGGSAGSAGGRGAGGGDQPKEKRQKVQVGEAERKKGAFRNRLNICCKEMDFAKALTVIEEMKQEDPPIALTTDQYIQLLHLCSSAEERHWKDGAVLLRDMEALLASAQDGPKVEFTEAMASGIIRMAACLADVPKALSTWEMVVSSEACCASAASATLPSSRACATCLHRLPLRKRCIGYPTPTLPYPYPTPTLPYLTLTFTLPYPDPYPYLTCKVRSPIESPTKDAIEPYQGY